MTTSSDVRKKNWEKTLKKTMMQNEQNFITYPTWKKYIVISYYVESLRVRDKRQLFHIMRKSSELSHDTFFPAFGITAGEFAIWQILSETRKCRSKKSYEET